MKKVTALLLTLVISTLTFAGSNQHKANLIAPEKIAEFAKQVELTAAKQGARAFIIARVGRAEKDLPKGIHFTHTAIAIYSAITLENGEIVKGYAIHNLYQDAEHPDKSSLVVDYPVDFSGAWNH